MAMTADVSRSLDLDFAPIRRRRRGDAARAADGSRHGSLIPSIYTPICGSTRRALGRVFSTALRCGYDAVGFMLDAWACVMLALPPILMLIPVPRPRSWTASKARWALHVERYRKPIVLVTLALALGLAWEGRGLNWSARLFDDLPKDREARATSEWIDQKLGAILPLEVVIRTQEADAWNDPERIRRMSALLARLREIDGVGNAIGLSDLIEAGSRAQKRELPATRAGIAELIFLYSLSEDRVTNQFLTPDGMQTRLSLRVRDIPGARMNEAVARVRAETQAAFPGLEVQTVGMAANVHIINGALCRNLIYGFWQAILLISAVLLVIFRSLRWTLAAMLPNLISPVALMGVMAFTGTPIKPGIALIFSIALGIAYNNTVYLLGRVRWLRQRAKARGAAASPELPITKAWYQEGNPCVFSTLALVGGFGVFMASYFELNRVFGAYMLLSIFAGMLGDLIFLPALLGWFPGLLGRDKAAPALSASAPPPPKKKRKIPSPWPPSLFDKPRGRCKLGRLGTRSPTRPPHLAPHARAHHRSARPGALDALWRP